MYMIGATVGTTATPEMLVKDSNNEEKEEKMLRPNVPARIGNKGQKIIKINEFVEDEESSDIESNYLDFPKERCDLQLEEDKKEGHLIVKIDIEGAEYDLMEEVANSGVLCDYKAMGNTVDLVVEYHPVVIIDPKERDPLLAKQGKAENKLRECGVEIQGMSAM